MLVVSCSWDSLRWTPATHPDFFQPSPDFWSCPWCATVAPTKRWRAEDEFCSAPKQGHQRTSYNHSCLRKERAASSGLDSWGFLACPHSWQWCKGLCCPPWVLRFKRNLEAEIKAGNCFWFVGPVWSERRRCPELVVGSGGLPPPFDSAAGTTVPAPMEWAGGASTRGCLFEIPEEMWCRHQVLISWRKALSDGGSFMNHLCLQGCSSSGLLAFRVVIFNRRFFFFSFIFALWSVFLRFVMGHP